MAVRDAACAGELDMGLVSYMVAARLVAGLPDGWDGVPAYVQRRAGQPTHLIV